MSKFIDLTDKKFGEWTVLGFYGRKEKHYYWKCVCNNCGTEKLVRANNLNSGTSKSCGCLKKVDMKRRRFERLLVLESIDKRTSDGSLYWRCQCKCGNITIVSRGNLLNGHVTSCGCLEKENLNNYLHFEGTNIGKIKSTRIPKNNLSGVRGVCWVKRTSKWRSTIRFKQKQYSLGYYKDLKDATAIRKKAEEEIFGEFLEWYDSRFSKLKQL